jgi:molecular chaperone DnaJ
MTQDYYEILGVSKNASQDELKRAYRQLARKLHPDTNQDDPQTEEEFKKVTLAYEVLSNPESRRRYDMFGPEAIRGSGAQGTGSTMGDGFFGAGGLGDVFEAFFGSSPFGGGFGSQSRSRGPQKGPDAEARLTISFEEAVFGVHKELSVKLPVGCPKCSGTGAAPGTSPVTCSSCGGSGEIRKVRQSILGQMVTASQCPQCVGTGEMIASPCSECRGDGRVTQERTFTVEVPAGVDSGATLRLNNRGPSGIRGGPNGDLYVHLSVTPHNEFQRDGYDLIREVRIPMTQAAFGGQLEVASLDSQELINIAPGTQSGKSYRIKDRGVPHINSRSRGDLIVYLVVETPTKMSREEEEVLSQFAKLRGEEPLAQAESIRSKIRSAFR